MKEWILVLFVASGGSGGPAIVDGYASRAECEKAKPAIVEAFANQGDKAFFARRAAVEIAACVPKRAE
jgi:hypothetical protein